MAPIVSRNNASSNGISNIAIVGFCLAGGVALIAFIWLGIRLNRKRAQGNREKDLGAAFLNVRGLVKDGEFTEKSTEPLPGDIQAIQGPIFSRTQDATVTMPDKALIRPNAAKEDIVEYHAQAGNLPRPFAPFSFALAAGGQCAPAVAQPGHRVSATSFITTTRDSFLSIGSSSRRLSAISSISSLGQTTKRKVRRIFEPVLPDELVLSVGERITIIQSFDDGWCIVGRPSLMKADDLEMGAVPAWCFVKPVKGLRVERPMRIASLGVTVQFDQSGHASRDDVISWSNF